MIIFDLACKQEHAFEGWFQSQAAYDSQVEKGFVLCPQCGSNEIRRVPSALHISRPSSSSVADSETLAPQSSLAAYQQIMSLIASNCEDVGNDFAQEARKMHYMEAPLRSIRGKASDEDYEGLREEGIEVLRLPSVKKEDLN